MTSKKVRPKKGDAIGKESSERDISAALGVSRRWLWQAKQIAGIPDAEFERILGSDDPHTIEGLVNVARQRAGSRKASPKVCPHCGGDL